MLNKKLSEPTPIVGQQVAVKTIEITDSKKILV